MAQVVNKIGLDASDLISEIGRANSALESNKDSVVALATALAKFNKEVTVEGITVTVRGATAQFKALTEQGEIITKTLKKNGQGWKEVGESIKSATNAITAYQREQKKLADQQKLAAAQGIAGPLLAGLDQSNVAGASTGKQKTFASSQGAVVQAIAGSGLDAAAVKEMFDKINAGIIEVETGARLKLQRAFLGVKQSIEAIDAAAQKAAEKEIAATEKVFEAKVKAIQALDEARGKENVKRQAEEEKALALAEKNEEKKLEARLREIRKRDETAAKENLKRQQDEEKALAQSQKLAEKKAREARRQQEEIDRNFLKDRERQEKENERAQREAEKARSGGESLLISWQGAVRLFQAVILRTVAHEILNVFIQAVKQAEEFQKAVNKITAVAPQSKGVGSVIAGKAAEFGEDRLTTTKAVLDHFGASLNNVGRTTDVLSAALNLQKVTTLDLSSALTLVDQTLRLYNLDASQATQVSEQFYAALSKGSINAKEFENGIGHLLVTTKDVGVTLEETLAFVDYFTSKGLSTRDAISSVDAIIRKLLTPTKEMQEVFHKWGVTTGEQAIATYGLQGVLQKLGEEYRTGGLSKLGDLEKDFKAIRGSIIALGDPQVGKALSDLSKNYADARNSGKASTAANQANQNITFFESIGEGGKLVGNVWASIFERVLGTDEAAEAAAEAARANAERLGPGYREHFKLQPVDEIRKNKQNVEDQRNSTVKLLKDYELLRDVYEGITRKELGFVADRKSRIFESVNDLINADNKLHGTLEQNANEFFKKSAAALDKSIKTPSEVIAKQSDIIKRYFADLSRDYDSAQKRLDKLTADHDKKIFERRLTNLLPGQQDAAINEHVDKLQKQALKLIDSDNLDAARDKLKEIEQILDKQYSQQEAAMKVFEKLGVHFGSGVDTKKEEEIFKIQEKIETDLLKKKQDSFTKQLENIRKLSEAETDYNKILKDRENNEWLKNYNKAIKELEEQLKKIIDLQQRIGKPIPGLEPQRRASGGYIQPKYFSEGGPVGTDVIPAWLSPGEYVMDAENTAKFFPQLVTMSMGIRPSYNNTDRSISVGDINISYQGTDSSQTDVRKLGEQLRREIRRGALRWD